MLTVQTTIKLPGFHRWPDAPDEVAFLRNTHRHLFHITAEVEVDHDNRDVEFFILQDVLRRICAQQQNLSLVFVDARSANAGLSCEGMAELIVRELRESKYVPVRVSVSEDGESAGTWYRDDVTNVGTLGPDWMGATQERLHAALDAANEARYAAR